MAAGDGVHAVLAPVTFEGFATVRDCAISAGQRPARFAAVRLDSSSAEARCCTGCCTSPPPSGVSARSRSWARDAAHGAGTSWTAARSGEPPFCGKRHDNQATDVSSLAPLACWPSSMPATEPCSSGRSRAACGCGTTCRRAPSSWPCTPPTLPPHWGAAGRPRDGRGARTADRHRPRRRRRPRRAALAHRHRAARPSGRVLGALTRDQPARPSGRAASSPRGAARYPGGGGAVLVHPTARLRRDDVLSPGWIAPTRTAGPLPPRSIPSSGEPARSRAARSSPSPGSAAANACLTCWPRDSDPRRQAERGGCVGGRRRARSLLPCRRATRAGMDFLGGLERR